MTESENRRSLIFPSSWVRGRDDLLNEMNNSQLEPSSPHLETKPRNLLTHLQRPSHLRLPFTIIISSSIQCTPTPSGLNMNRNALTDIADGVEQNIINSCAFREGRREWSLSDYGGCSSSKCIPNKTIRLELTWVWHLRLPSSRSLTKQDDYHILQVPWNWDWQLTALAFTLLKTTLNYSIPQLKVLLMPLNEPIKLTSWAASLHWLNS